ncbi:GAF domain-containing protein [Pelagirhabdus alkalitolerans]|uniref:GAF domain-containing protein n=1 Tax=Pelagirhabdus alkalitolerans TaxID=1612202 RepID=A0A1G6HJD9_9BACI|nr:GAF domain-containing protein [Pelagirhabdus alkalitolerans]SDB94263.1 GAF domain-containing protein [Pelagirhabdus alkalitolerans]
MFEKESYDGTRERNYERLLKQLEALIEDEPNTVANLSNSSALLNQFLDRVNWVGFYLMDGEDELILGPFQGLPACLRIKVGSGVCGTAVSEKTTQRVENVHEFPGHIACDADTNSEIVVPLVKNDRVIGVLDIDSPELDRFDSLDESYLEAFAEILTKYL